MSFVSRIPVKNALIFRFKQLLNDSNQLNLRVKIKDEHFPIDRRYAAFGGYHYSSVENLQATKLHW